MGGTHIKGYELQERIGAGGFGTVHRAFQSTVGREVAIKIILPRFASHPDFIRRFENEAHVVACLEHPFIVPLYDYWREPDGAYLVMRYMRGGSLRDAIKKGPFEVEAAGMLLDQITSALALAHRGGVIHRDLKPGNILLDEDGYAYLADFGIAKNYAAPGEAMTDPEDLIGSPDYLAPEQAHSAPVTPRTDVYSMGVVVFEMLAGEHPFPNTSPIERMYKHLNEALPPLQNLSLDIQDAVNDVIQKATAKNPAHRFEDAMELAAAFREAAALNSITPGASIVEQLTLREHEILYLLTNGLSNQAIADELVVTLSTVKWYVSRIYKKLHVRNRVQAIVRARELDLVLGDIDDMDEKTASPASYISLPEPNNPYKGLRAFQTADARDYFGRERLTQRLLKKLDVEDGGGRFLAVVGPSGSGKSSLVKAGLMPALLRGDLPDSDRWFIVEMLPGTHPLDELEIALMKIAANQADNLHEQLQRDERGLVRVAQLILPDDGSELVIVIDQFEEAFTLVEDEARRQHFLNLIRLAVTDPHSRIRIVVTLRADFYDRPLHHPEFGALMRDRVETILPLSAEELERAIIKPAEQTGVKYEDGLVARIIDDVLYQSGALPLLQYALTELFEQADNRILTQAAYQAIGGTVGALARRADELYAEYDETGQEIIRQMFLRLVTLGEGAEDTRRRVSRAELLATASNHEDLIEDVINTFTEYRLLALDHNPATRQPTVEVAHEAILREWEMLRAWLNESREDIKQQRQLNSLAAEWTQNQQDESYLVSGNRLEQFQLWSTETELSLTAQEMAFLSASNAQAEHQTQLEEERQAREAALKQRAQRVLQSLVAVFLIAAIVSGGLAFWANNQRTDAETARNSEVEAREQAQIQASIGLAALAVQQLESTNPERGVLVALAALEEVAYTPHAQSALARTVEQYRSRQELQAGEVHHTPLSIASWSPDGKLIAAGGGAVEKEVVIWDVATGEVVLAVNIHHGNFGDKCNSVTDLVWSPPGDRIATMSYNCGTAIWDSLNGEILLALPETESQKIYASWSPDGTQLITGHEDGSIIFWDASTGDVLQTFAGHTDTVPDVKFSPDGKFIVSVSHDETIRVWDAGDEDSVLVLDGHIGPVQAVAWSPDGTRFVTGGDDGLIRIWDRETGSPLLVLRGHEDRINDLDWSADGARIASLSRDGTVRVWSALTGDYLYQIRNVSPGAYDAYVEFSPDGQSIIATDTGPGQGKVWIWDASMMVQKLYGHTLDALFSGFSPDGTMIATSGSDRTARIWDRVSGNQLMVFEISNVPLIGDWSPDSTRVVVTVDGSGYYIFDVTTGEKILHSPAPGKAPDFLVGAIYARWSPDGTRIALTTYYYDEGNSPAFVVDATTGDVLVSYLPEEGCPQQAFPEWSPDSTRIVTGCQAFGEQGKNTHARIWDAATGEELMRLESEHGWTFGATWSPDGSQIAVAYEAGPIKIWDVDSRQVVRTFVGHTSLAYYAAWSSDGTLIASRDMNGTVKIWNATTLEEILVFTTPSGGHGTIDWSPDDTQVIVSGTYNEPIIKRVWLDTEDLIAHAYECCAFRELTLEERQQFGLPERD